MLLIIIGGIGFLTWEDICENKLQFRRYRMQSKVILYLDGYPDLSFRQFFSSLLILLLFLLKIVFKQLSSSQSQQEQPVSIR